MKGSAKVWLIVASALTAAGIIIFIGALAMLKFNFSNIFTSRYQTSTKEVSDKFNSIYINTVDADISILPSDDDTCKVICYENPKMQHSVHVSDSALTIDCVNERKWYDYIGINTQSPTLTVYIPSMEYSSLCVKAQTSDIGVPSGFSFESIDISVSTGDIELDGVSSKNISLRASTGAIDISSIRCEENLDITVKTGTCELKGVTCKSLTSNGTTGKLLLTDVTASVNACFERDTGDVTLTSCLFGALSIETSTGDVNLDACDAEKISISTNTGDIEGSLLTEKVFITDAKTGSIRVPSSGSGGICEITTDTGDIEITIK